MQSRLFVLAAAVAAVSATHPLALPKLKRDLEVRQADDDSVSVAPSCSSAVLDLVTALPTPPPSLMTAALDGELQSALASPCQVTLAASLSSDLVEYASDVQSWYQSHSSDVSSVLEECSDLVSLLGGSLTETDIPVCSTTASGSARTTSGGSASRTASETSAATPASSASRSVETGSQTSASASASASSSQGAGSAGSKTSGSIFAAVAAGYYLPSNLVSKPPTIEHVNRNREVQDHGHNLPKPPIIAPVVLLHVPRQLLLQAPQVEDDPEQRHREPQRDEHEQGGPEPVAAEPLAHPPPPEDDAAGADNHGVPLLLVLGGGVVRADEPAHLPEGREVHDEGGGELERRDGGVERVVAQAVEPVGEAQPLDLGPVRRRHVAARPVPDGAGVARPEGVQVAGEEGVEGQRGGEVEQEEAGVGPGRGGGGGRGGGVYATEEEGRVQQGQHGDDGDGLGDLGLDGAEVGGGDAEVLLDEEGDGGDLDGDGEEGGGVEEAAEAGEEDLRGDGPERGVEAGLEEEKDGEGEAEGDLNDRRLVLIMVKRRRLGYADARDVRVADAVDGLADHRLALLESAGLISRLIRQGLDILGEVGDGGELVAVRHCRTCSSEDVM
ncbi:unnamed protein product [Clonostachys solani]|uniref:Uncharacterized protein n=1 Tax=Clonostachys solani TaxID=160281 RepID=A0A9N9W8H5_9HYPO|nr:unnamed protein product [Clonostachys solani]